MTHPRYSFGEGDTIFYVFNRLRELLRARLKECGWRDQLKDHCRGSSHHMLAVCYPSWPGFRCDIQKGH